MQAVLSRTDDISDILVRLRNVDSESKNEIENNIVDFGSRIVEHLVRELKSLKGIARGIVAMSLIRIGKVAIVPLRREAMKDRDFAWVADYLISEIEA